MTATKTTITSDNNYIVLDIRSQDEQDRRPLTLNSLTVKHIPFYKLKSQFSNLDQSKQYFLYCDNGLMSRLQVLHLRELGFLNVKIYSPKT